jgi:hypothetical protein
MKLGLDEYCGFTGNSTKTRHENYRRFRDIEGLGGSDSSGGLRGSGDISRDIL